MARGFKIADAYVELTVDKDGLRQSVRDIPSAVGGDADRAGRDLGERVTKGLEARVEQLAARVARSRREVEKATDAVKLAEVKLNETRESGKAKASQLLAAEQRLEQSKRKLADADSAATTASRRHAEAEAKLAHDLANAARSAGPEAERGGRDLGDKLTAGMHLAIIRNSPLIVAGIGAALALGGPAVLSASVGLFAGIGIAAAAQSQKVRSAWAGTWSSIKQGAIEDAAVLVPVVTGAAGKIERSFQGLRPAFREGFEAAAPYVDKLTTSITRAAEQAVPALTRSVKGAGPVVDGLGSIIDALGTGTAGFLDNVTAHSPAAGAAFQALARIVSALLPLLGNLLGQGAELAQIVLPPLARVIEVVADAADHLGPLLPILATGFTALKVAKTAASWVDALGGRLGTLAAKDLPGVSRAAGAAKGALSTVGEAAPGIGIALAALGVIMDRVNEQADQWAHALLEGGSAADTARSQMNDFGTAMDQTNTGLGGLAAGFLGVNGQVTTTALAIQKAKDRARELYDQMSPLQQAQSDVTRTQNDLAEAVSKWGDDSGQAVAASQAYRDAQEHLKQVQEDLERATHGVTQAMLEQANQALAAADANFAYNDATYRVKDAEDALNTAIKEHGRSSEEAERATNQLNEALSAQVAAASRVAVETSGVTDKTEQQKIALAAQLQELYKLRDQYGSNFPAALQQTIARLEATGVKLDWLDTKNPSPDVTLNTGQFSDASGYVAARMGQINVMRAFPWLFAQADVSRAEASLSWAARARYSVIYTTVAYSGTSGSGGTRYRIATGGRMGDVRAGRAGARGFAGGGRVSGPGGPLGDRVGPFASADGDVFLSDDEWIIRAFAARRYGDKLMQAVNDGQAVVSVPPPPQPVGTAAGRVSPAPPSSLSTGTSGSGGAGGGGVHVDHLEVKITGTFDLTNPREMRRVGEQLRDVLVDLERERR